MPRWGGPPGIGGAGFSPRGDLSPLAAFSGRRLAFNRLRWVVARARVLQSPLFGEQARPGGAWRRPTYTAADPRPITKQPRVGIFHDLPRRIALVHSLVWVPRQFAGEERRQFLLLSQSSPTSRRIAASPRHFGPLLSTTPKSVSTLGAASSTASRLWQAPQSWVTLRPSALAWLSS